MSEIAAALIKDVPRYDPCNCGGATVPDGHLVTYPDVLAALTTALDPALAERAGEVLPRLRKADEYEPLGYDGWEAADLITALLAQNGALRKERDEHAEALKVNNAVLCDALLRNVAAEAEVEKLTGALESIANDVDLMATGRTSLLGKMGRTARAALSTTEEGK